MRGVVDIGAVEQNQILVGGAAAHVEANRKIGKRGNTGQGLDRADRVGLNRRRRGLELAHLQDRTAGAYVEALDLLAIGLDHCVLDLDRFLAKTNITKDIFVCDHEFFAVDRITDH